MFESLQKKLSNVGEKEESTLRLKAKAFGRGEVILDEADVEGALWDLEIALLEADVAMGTVEAIREGMKERLVGRGKVFLKQKKKIIKSALREVLEEILTIGSFDFFEEVKSGPRPYLIIFLGVNGTGKTTTIAKVGKYLADRGLSVVVASGDTVRAGAEEQIEVHASRLNFRVIKHKQGGDPAAVIYDAREHARAKNIDVVLADTAGRMHTNINLRDQLAKICRVNEPQLKVFVDEAIAGNDVMERARQFNDSVGIDCAILTKADADAKGGAAISVAQTTGAPIIFLGTGQDYDDLVPFEPSWLVESLLGK